MNDVNDSDGVNMEILTPERILNAGIDAENQNREIMDDEIPYRCENKYIEFNEKSYNFTYGKCCLSATNFAQMLKSCGKYLILN